MQICPGLHSRPYIVKGRQKDPIGHGPSVVPAKPSLNSAIVALRSSRVHHIVAAGEQVESPATSPGAETDEVAAPAVPEWQWIESTDALKV